MFESDKNGTPSSPGNYSSQLTIFTVIYYVYIDVYTVRKFHLKIIGNKKLRKITTEIAEVHDATVFIMNTTNALPIL